MTSISFYVDYCFEAGNENCNSNLTGRYEFLMEFSDDMSVELYKVWCENNYELNPRHSTFC